MLLLRGLLFLVVIGVWIYCIFDVVRSDPTAVRYMHKLIWLVLVLLFNPVGPLVWLFLGRPEPIGSRLFEQQAGSPRAPDDSPEFLAKLDDEIRRRKRADRLRAKDDVPSDDDPQKIEDEIRRLEEELRRRAENEGGDQP